MNGFAGHRLDLEQPDVQRSIEGWQRRTISRAAARRTETAIHHEPVEWEIIGSTDWSRTFHGKPSVVTDLLRPLGDQFDGPVEATRFIADGDIVAVEGRNLSTTKRPFGRCPVYRQRTDILFSPSGEGRRVCCRRDHVDRLHRICLRVFRAHPAALRRRSHHWRCQRRTNRLLVEGSCRRNR